jgi:hypothetical protein
VFVVFAFIALVFVFVVFAFIALVFVFVVFAFIAVFVCLRFFYLQDIL